MASVSMLTMSDPFAGMETPTSLRSAAQTRRRLQTPTSPFARRRPRTAGSPGSRPSLSAAPARRAGPARVELSFDGAPPARAGAALAAAGGAAATGGVRRRRRRKGRAGGRAQEEPPLSMALSEPVLEVDSAAKAAGPEYAPYYVTSSTAAPRPRPQTASRSDVSRPLPRDLDLARPQSAGGTMVLELDLPPGAEPAAAVGSSSSLDPVGHSMRSRQRSAEPRPESRELSFSDALSDAAPMTVRLPPDPNMTEWTISTAHRGAPAYDGDGRLSTPSTTMVGYSSQVQKQFNMLVHREHMLLLDTHIQNLVQPKKKTEPGPNLEPEPEPEMQMEPEVDLSRMDLSNMPMDLPVSHQKVLQYAGSDTSVKSTRNAWRPPSALARGPVNSAHTRRDGGVPVAAAGGRAAGWLPSEIRSLKSSMRRQASVTPPVRRHGR